MPSVDVLKAQIVRDAVTTDWGFILVGGVDTGEPLRFASVTPGSPAARIGLKTGDEVVEIGDTDSERLTQQQAQICISQYGLSLILTVERKATGFVPHNPVLHGTPQPTPLKSYQTFNMAAAQTTPVFKPGPGGKMVATASPASGSPKSPGGVTDFFPNRRLPPDTGPQITTKYQTYDMTGAPRTTGPPQTNQNTIQFQTAKAAPFRTPVSQPSPKTYQPPAEARPAYQEPARYNSTATSPSSDYGYDDGTQSQSRTFRMLQGLMENNAPGAGSTALPPPRSAAYEKMQHSGSGPARMKVFMPQQYNTPVGLYSTQNVVTTFQDQAEHAIDTLSPHGSEMSDLVANNISSEDL